MPAERRYVPPLHRVAPAYKYTMGDAVAELCDTAGFAPDAEQADALNVVFGMGDDDLPVVFEFGLIAPRYGGGGFGR